MELEGVSAGSSKHKMHQLRLHLRRRNLLVGNANPLHRLFPHEGLLDLALNSRRLPVGEAQAPQSPLLSQARLRNSLSQPPPPRAVATGCCPEALSYTAFTSRTDTLRSRCWLAVRFADFYRLSAVLSYRRYITLPQGNYSMRSCILKLMTSCPLRAGKLFPLL
jgi:hypothetical protein